MKLWTLIRDRRGNVAPMFGLVLVPIFAATAIAVDYSRAGSARTEMQGALDSAALMVSKEAINLTNAQLQEKAAAYFEANYHHPEAKKIKVKASYVSNGDGTYTVKVTGSGVLDTALFQYLGGDKLKISSQSEVTWGMRRLELALALDNTGSMNESGKLPALKSAVHELLTTLEKASRRKDDIKIAIVPFTTFVNVGVANKKAKWIDWEGWIDNDAVGTEPGSDAAAVTLVSTTDTTTTKKNDKSKWTGCVMDRTQPYDVEDAKPTKNADALFPAAECTNPVELLPLTSDWTSLHGKTDAMVGNGTTNVTIGLSWAWHALSSSQPLTEGSAPAKDLDKVVVLLTDGDNTENRWTTSGTQIDARTNLACANIKSAGITLYTVRVIAGNASLLQGCASSPAMYFDVQRASELNAVFKTIAENLSSLRLSK